MMINDPIPPRLGEIAEMLERAISGSATPNELDQIYMRIEDVEEHLRLVATSIPSRDKGSTGSHYPFGPEAATKADIARRYAYSMKAAAVVKDWQTALNSLRHVKDAMV